MDATTAGLQRSFRLAQSRDWNLLVCAIGAELDAFQQGRRLLRAALGLDNDEGENSQDSVARSDVGLNSGWDRASNGSDQAQARPIRRQPLEQSSYWTPTRSAAFEDAREAQDDDPELLISRHDDWPNRSADDDDQPEPHLIVSRDADLDAEVLSQDDDPDPHLLLSPHVDHDPEQDSQ